MLSLRGGKSCPESLLAQGVVEFVIAMSLVFPVVGMAQGTALIEEIVVTAQKREQNLQNVSISVTALTGDMISAFGFQDTLQDLQADTECGCRRAFLFRHADDQGEFHAELDACGRRDRRHVL